MTATQTPSNRTRTPWDSTVAWIGALTARYGLVIVIAWIGALKFTAYEAQNDTSRIILTCPEIMDDAMFGLARDRLDFFQAEIRRFLIRLIEAEASGEESPTYNNEDFDLLAFYVCAQIIGFFLLNNILDISPPRAWSWEKIENDFADRLYGMIFGANSEIK